MKITITITDEQPWYAPYSSQEAWLRAQEDRRKYEERERQKQFEKDFGAGVPTRDQIWDWMVRNRKK